MKRSQKEYEEILNFIKSELTNSPNPWHKPPTKELEARFNDWATDNNIKPVSLRTIQNYLNVLKEDKEFSFFYNMNPLNQNWHKYNKSYSTISIDSNEYEGERIELAQKLLQSWLRVLPIFITKELAQQVKAKVDYPALRIAHPHYLPKKGFNEMMLEFMSMIYGGKICRFMYKPGHSNLDDNMEQSPEGFSWLKEVYCMPLQLSIYLDRVYLLAYSLSKDELLDGQYEVHTSDQVESPLKYAKISRFVLANINDYRVEALEKYVLENAELGPLMDPIGKFQKQFKPSYILEAFSIPQIQEDIIGVVLPDEEQLGTDAKTTLDYGMDKKDSSPFKPFAPYIPPKPILRYFSGWAMRYILNSPLHPSQRLIDPMVDIDILFNWRPGVSQSNKSMEIGLFEFTVWNTVDFEFRVASFREWSWPVENGSEGQYQEQNINLKTITKILNEMALKFDSNSLSGSKGLRLLLDEIQCNVENATPIRIQESVASNTPLMDSTVVDKGTDSPKKSIYIQTNQDGQKSIKAGNCANRYNVAWAQQYRNFWWLSFKGPNNNHDPFFFYMRGDIINQLREITLRDFWVQAIGPIGTLPNGQGRNFEAHLKFNSFEDILEFLGHFYEINFCN